MIKLAANAALMTRISFINEIANVCEATGADVVKVAEGIGLDRRIGKSFLRAGVGFGGSLLPEGLARAEAARRELRLPLPAAERGDRGQRAPEAPRDRQADASASARCGASAIALLGLAFKPNTDDMREAPAFVLAGRLLAEGADVVAWDPVAHGRRPARRRAGRDGRRAPSRAPTPSCS